MIVNLITSGFYINLIFRKNNLSEFLQSDEIYEENLNSYSNRRTSKVGVLDDNPKK